MPSIAPSKSTTTTRVARVPYLNSAPFFRGLTLGERYELVDCSPRELGQRAEAGEVLAGLLPLVDYFRLEDRFERLGPFGIAVRGRARSVVLFSRKPIQQLDGATVTVTEETSTTAVLLRLLLEQRYKVTPAAYARVRAPHTQGAGCGVDERVPQPKDAGPRGTSLEADALLLIGDEALRFQQVNTQYPYEIDIAFEWWLWQHAPCVFAVWAIRKDASTDEKKHLETALSKSLGLNTRQLDLIAQEGHANLGLPAEMLQIYLASFIYRLSQPEEDGINRLRALVHEHRLL